MDSRLLLTSMIKNSDGRDVEGEMSSTFAGNHSRILARMAARFLCGEKNSE